LFGRRNRGKREDVARAEEAREAERRALFEQLAKRPENVCPFLGMAEDRAGYQPEPNGEHRCYAFGDPAPLSDEQQRHVCLERGYSNCPRYLRGVLVIPTEELEALRRPQAHVPVPVLPKPPPKARRSGARRAFVLLLPVLLLIAAVGVGGWYLFMRNPVAIGPSATPSASAASATPFPETPTPGPTVAPGDTRLRDEVTVLQGNNTLFRVNADGTVAEQVTVEFSRFSTAPVSRREINGVRWWTTLSGKYRGWSYIKDRSGPFIVRTAYRSSSGQLHYTQLSGDQT
jgi:hypothetical protein